MRFSEHLPALPAAPWLGCFGGPLPYAFLISWRVEPDLLFWVVTGNTLQQMALGSESSVIRALRPGLAKNQKLSPTTLRLISDLLRSVLPPNPPLGVIFSIGTGYTPAGASRLRLPSRSG